MSNISLLEYSLTTKHPKATIWRRETNSPESPDVKLLPLDYESRAQDPVVQRGSDLHNLQGIFSRDHPARDLQHPLSFDCTEKRILWYLYYYACNINTCLKGCGMKEILPDPQSLYNPHCQRHLTAERLFIPMLFSSCFKCLGLCLKYSLLCLFRNMGCFLWTLLKRIQFFKRLIFF